MRFFYFLPLLFILTACPFSSDEDIAPQVDTRPVRFVEGADTTTIKISDTESFNLNNFLVCFEQIVEDDYYQILALDHTYNGSKILNSLYTNQYLKPYIFSYNQFDYVYQNEIITAVNSSHDNFYNFKFDIDGLIKEYTRGLKGNEYNYNVEYDKYKNVISETDGITDYLRFYDDSNNIVRWNMNGGAYILYEYSDNRPTKSTRYDPQDKPFTKTEMNYNERGQIIGEDLFWYYEDGTFSYSKKEFEYLTDTLIFITYANDIADNSIIVGVSGKKNYNLNSELVKKESFITNTYYIKDNLPLALSETYFTPSGESHYKMEILEMDGENRSLLGYVEVDVRQSGNANYTKTATFRDANGEFINTIEYSDSVDPNNYTYQFKDIKGSVIDETNVPYWIISSVKELFFIPEFNKL
ncbi:hypothetical protein [Marinigracilibium pacificum]|uniref:YD repeat-containing protein n=1 Tax=Marinigracilibium pacificum TaxID=2729599 RepID=A0A848IZY4_9BACT|nr:hypothetical protein [Marinigracilibium pacificum]NMM48951.1 hypothetical protein [Marinigracilibium pacificum]